MISKFRASRLPRAWPLGPGLRHCLVMLLPSAALIAADAPPSVASPVASVRQAVSDWARIRAETVRLETTWESERPLLESTLKTMQERAQSLQGEKQTLEATSADGRRTIEALIRENAGSQASLDAASARLQEISGQLVALRSSLPPRLSRALELPYRSLAAPDLGPGERMQLIMTVLNRCAQFNNVITYDEEPLELPGQSEARLLEAIYWGASHAYALDRTDHKAYFGAPRAGRWSWELLPDGAGDVADLIAIYREKADPRFVQVTAHSTDAPTH